MDLFKAIHYIVLLIDSENKWKNLITI
jgi:hypothetical protein